MEFAPPPKYDIFNFARAFVSSSSPGRVPPPFPALGSRVRRLVYKLGTHHAKSPYGAVLLHI